MMGCMTVFIIANKLTTAANAIVIQYLLPVWVLIIGAVFYKQKVKRADVIAVIICIAGIALFFFDQLSPGNMIGNCLAILSGICMAIMFTGNSQCNDSDVQLTALIMGHVLTFIVGLSGFFLEPFHTTMPEIGYILALGILQIGVPYILFSYVSTKISTLACSLIGMLEPLLNPVWVAIFYGEVPGFCALIGGIIIIVTTSVWCVVQSRQT
jgi:drug/metabolite transporter (DMT)-like permease